MFCAYIFLWKHKIAAKSQRADWCIFVRRLKFSKRVLKKTKTACQRRVVRFILPECGEYISLFKRIEPNRSKLVEPTIIIIKYIIKGTQNSKFSLAIFFPVAEKSCKQNTFQMQKLS